MKHFTMLLLSVLLVAGLAFAGEEPDTRKAPATQNPGVTFGIEAGWLPIPEVTLASHQFVSVQYLDTVAWIAGFRTSSPRTPVAYYSIKGGGWTKINLPGANRGSFEAWDAKLAMYATTDGKIFRTTDGGTKWDSVYAYTAGGDEFFSGVKFVGKDVAIAMGDADTQGLHVVRSTDGGASWARVTNLPAADSAMLYGYFTNGGAMDVFGNTVWMAAYKGSGTLPRLIRSTDAGATWNSWELNLTGGATNNYYIRSINFLDDNVGYLVDRAATSSNYGYIHKTTDGGATWSDSIAVNPSAPHGTQELRAATPIRGTNIVVVTGQDFTVAAANRGRVWWSTDGGATFQPVVAMGGELWKAAFKSATEGLVVGNTNALKYTVKNVRAVTFMMNTATVPDTIPVAGSTIQMRGGVNHAGGFSPITWGSEAQNNMTAAGGDYWKKTLYMQAGDTLSYKYVIAYSTGTGWEQGVVPADFPSQTNANRSLIVPDKDTTLAVEFWNNGANNRPQYFRPWAATTDSFFTVYFRVNMNGIISAGSYGYNGDKDTLAVRGGGSAGSDLDWGRSTYLTREAAPSNGDGYTSAPTSFWSGGLKIKKAGLTEGATIGFKYLIGSDWNRPNGTKADEAADRNFKVPVGFKDTTLHWVYFNNDAPSARANPDTVRMTFVANLAQAAASGGFDVTKDTLYVRTGYFSTAIESGRGKRMLRLSGTIFQVTDTIVTAKKKLLDYQYYTVRDAQEVRENYYNYYYTGAVASEAERRQVMVDSTASLTTTQTVRDTATSITQARRQPVFPNGRKLARNVNVKWECDLRPAYYQVKLGGDSLSDIQGTFTVRVADVDSIMKWGVWMNGPAVGGWANDGGDWGLGLQNNLAKKLFDNGTNGDRVAGDSIFTRQVLASPDSVAIGSKDRVGQTFKFGIRGGDNEGGKGGFGNNHNENIVDTDSIYTMSTQFGSINPAFYDAWDYDLRKPKTPTSVFDPNAPLVYELAQNYPNPFNPATKIEYSIPMQSQVELKIYNLVGQEVGTLVNEIQKAGVHNVKFDAGNLASGVYFYRLVAGNFTSVKKMVLLK
jgi:photosystem II stability/assembly factor-like uncharacterized protein